MLGRTDFRRGVAGAAAVAVLVGTVAACDYGAAVGDSVAVPGRATLAQALDETIHRGYRTETAGGGDLASGERFRDGDHIRLRNDTETFVAAVFGQPVSEGTVELDAPLERYLSGVVAGDGHDGDVMNKTFDAALREAGQ